MGLFDLFGKKGKTVRNPQSEKKKSDIAEAEKKYYQQDDYYTDVVFTGTPFEHNVVTFEERKKTAIPSKCGLYPAEILLLEYCSMGNYPEPKNGYPGFWWFSYGIRNVGAALKSLEDRGYIQFASAKDSLKKLTIPQLKELLSSHGYPTQGKKTDLIVRVSENIPEDVLIANGVQPKYQLTGIGQQELNENEYVAYLHKHQYMSVWDMNVLIYSDNPLKLGYRDLLWGEFNKNSLKHFNDYDFGLYRNIRLNMHSFLCEEEKYKTALSLLIEVISFDLSGLGNDDSPRLHSILPKKERFNSKMVNLFWSKDKTEITLPPGIIGYFEKLYHLIGMSSDEFIKFTYELFSEVQIHDRIFTEPECANIILSEIGLEKRKITNSYKVAESRVKKKLDL